ncbi:MAG: formylglycine-generating enzyme family protein [Myxococcota bacterium]|nr:formylglycine-generating enzyme family protein [Myxococcota bacterium]
MGVYGVCQRAEAKFVNAYCAKEAQASLNRALENNELPEGAYSVDNLRVEERSVCFFADSGRIQNLQWQLNNIGSFLSSLLGFISFSASCMMEADCVYYGSTHSYDEGLLKIAKPSKSGNLTKSIVKKMIAYLDSSVHSDELEHTITIVSTFPFTPSAEKDWNEYTAKWVKEAKNRLQAEEKKAEERRLVEEKEAEKRNASFPADLKKNPAQALSLVEVPAGTFMMGALPNDDWAYDSLDTRNSEMPRHEVTLTKGMLVSQYACTQGLYESVMGANPSHFKGLNRPVEQVSWCDAVLFCNKLSEMEGLEPVYVLPQPFENDNDWSRKVKWNKDANGYRLPTEAEWEYCARGGEYHLYAGSDNSDEVAWYRDNSGEETHPVGQKKANGFGLYDMSGNVWEWVWDDGRRKYDSSVTDPVFLDKHCDTIYRGGSYYYGADYARVSNRTGESPCYREIYLGFRFIRTI